MTIETTTDGWEDVDQLENTKAKQSVVKTENVRLIVDVRCINQILSAASKHRRTCVKSQLKVSGASWKILHLECTSCSKSMKFQKEKDGHELNIN